MKNYQNLVVIDQYRPERAQSVVKYAIIFMFLLRVDYGTVTGRLRLWLSARFERTPVKVNDKRLKSRIK